MLLMLAIPASAQVDWTSRIWEQVQQVQSSQSRMADALGNLKYAQEKRIVGVERLVYENQRRIGKIEQTLASEGIDTETSVQWWMGILASFLTVLFASAITLLGNKLWWDRKTRNGSEKKTLP